MTSIMWMLVYLLSLRLFCILSINMNNQALIISRYCFSIRGYLRLVKRYWLWYFIRLRLEIHLLRLYLLVIRLSFIFISLVKIIRYRLIIFCLSKPLKDILILLMFWDWIRTISFQAVMIKALSFGMSLLTFRCES